MDFQFVFTMAKTKIWGAESRWKQRRCLSYHLGFNLASSAFEIKLFTVYIVAHTV